MWQGDVDELVLTTQLERQLHVLITDQLIPKQYVAWLHNVNNLFELFLILRLLKFSH